MEILYQSTLRWNVFHFDVNAVPVVILFQEREMQEPVFEKLKKNLDEAKVRCWLLHDTENCADLMNV